MDLNHKIKQILLEKNLSPSQFADDIGVQRSSISHILTGRNRPSLDIIKKIVNTYTDIEIEWLLDIDHNSIDEAIPTVNKAPVSRDNHMHNQERLHSSGRPQRSYKDDSYSRTVDYNTVSRKGQEVSDAPLEVERILVFYSNGTFKEFKPG